MTTTGRHRTKARSWRHLAGSVMFAFTAVVSSTCFGQVQLNAFQVFDNKAVEPASPWAYNEREWTTFGLVRPRASYAQAGSDTPAAAETLPSVGPEIRPRAATAGSARELIRHLPNNVQGYRLVGEVGSSEWPIFLTEVQAAGRLRFQVGYLASISVMPEASVITVWINNKVIGRARIFAPNGVRVTEFDVPAGLTQYGFNSIRIGVEQRHRVDCSLAATYELWTQIDPSRTGLIMSAGDPGVSDLRDLAAIPADAQGIVPIRAVIPARTNMANLEHVLRAVQSIVLAGRFEQPVVDYGPVMEGRYGINLMIGTAAELATYIDASRIGTVAGPRVVVLPATPSERTAVIVTGTSAQEVEEALSRLLIEKEHIGSEAGLRAALNFPGFQIGDYQRIRLRDLGVVSTEFSGRFFRASFNIMTPPDFYPADYAKMFLNLDGGYASGLSVDSQIMVTINDRNAASLKLPNTAGSVFRGNALPIPVGLLRPGLNRVEIQAQVPMESDASCDPLAAIEGKKRFLLLDSSELVFPSIARIGRMPDLAVTTTGGFPFTSATGRPQLFVPTPDRDTMGAATTLAARFGMSAGRMIDFQVMLTAPPPGSGPTLAVSPARAFSAEQITAAGLDPEALRTAWEGRADLVSRRDTVVGDVEAAARRRIALQRNFPAACHMSSVPGALPPRTVGSGMEEPGPASRPSAIVDTSAQSDGQLYDQWREETRSRWWTRHTSEVWRVVRGWSDSLVTAITGGIRSSFESEPVPAISAQSSLIVSQAIAGRTIDDVWTYVIAPNAETLGESVACLVDPRVWRQIDGRVAFLDASQGRVTRIAADGTHFVQTQPLSLGNVRLIAASWLSLNQFAYVLLAGLVSLFLSASTMWLLRSIGRSSS